MGPRALLILVATSWPIQEAFAVVTLPSARPVAAATANLALLGRNAKRLPKKLTVRYRQAMDTHYLPMSAAQQCVLRGSADAAGFLISGAPIDPSHVAAMATLGFLVSGLGGASWLAHLEEALGGGTARSDVVRKTLSDYSCWAPVANSCYLFLVPLMMGHGVEAAANTLQSGFVSVMLLEAAIFMPYNLLAFNSIPAALRPPCEGLFAALFTIGLGIITSSSAPL